MLVGLTLLSPDLDVDEYKALIYVYGFEMQLCFRDHCTLPETFIE